MIAALFALPCLLLAPFQVGDAKPAPVRENREPLDGKVLDRSKKPRAGADVWLVTRSLPFTEQVGRTDVVRTKTKADGTFRADVLVGRGYSAWASWRDGESAWVTTVAEDVRAGRVLTLQAARIEFDSKIKLLGLRAWSDRQPLRARVRPLIENMWTAPIPVGRSGAAPLPLVPMGEPRADVEILASDGSILHCLSTWLTSRTGDPHEIDLSKFHEVRVQVVTNKGGKPIAGAEIRRRPQASPGFPYPGRAWGLLGTTSEAGLAEIRVLSKYDPTRKPHRVTEAWVVSAPGYADVLVGTNGRFFIGSRFISTTQNQVIVRMDPAQPLHGQVRIDAGKPAANVAVVVSTEWKIDGEKRSSDLRLPFYHVRTDEQGRFEVPGMPLTANATSACILLSKAECPDLPGWFDDEFPTAPVLSFRVDSPRPPSLGILSLSDYERVKLHFKAPPGGKQLGVRVRVHAVGGTTERSEFAPNLATDSSGRIGIVVRAGREYEVFAWADDVGWALHRFRTPTGGRAVQVRMREFVTLAGKVLTPDHKPIPRAWVRRPDEAAKGRVGIDGAIAQLNHDMLMTWADEAGEFRVRYVPNPYKPATLLAVARHSAHGPPFRSRELRLGTKPRSGVELVVDVPEDWLKNPDKYKK